MLTVGGATFPPAAGGRRPRIQPVRSVVTTALDVVRCGEGIKAILPANMGGVHDPR
jgi:hypothetical protein